MPLEESVLVEELTRRADREEGPKYNGFPERWWDAGAKRCLNDHVSHMVVKSEALGRDACFRSRCRAPVHLTFPEDKDGPLEPTEVPKDWECYSRSRNDRMRCGSMRCPLKGQCTTEAPDVA